MTVITADLSLSLDGYSTGYGQREDAPFGDGTGERMHEWMFDHADENRDEIDAILTAKAYIMGRNMFGPIRGAWQGDWRGWWGDTPPYRSPVFVLSHHSREPVVMEGGTTFHFVTDGVESAMEQARDAAGDGDVSIAGGAATLNQFLAAGHLDILRLHVVPLTFGLSGHPEIVRLFDGVPPLHLTPVQARTTPHVTHLTYDLR
ncbi:hypothetical protein ASD65_00750 [Microbacterium sp. Root61]|uniref:dihydrofolate reductase family protein n=1 Tax=Microbacterium sp. Root61 TaxID=1736570 RepID=UPI0006FFBAFC|nr:dihydrofolate reductase family protein [Microbacterium sp. Root61]KRA23108.1 hypothetical protein ASD65_00750 [Microbacterium sp. Root61]